MNYRILLFNITLTVSLFCSGCVQMASSFSSDAVQATAANETEVKETSGKSLTEDFEGARISKTSYVSGTVPFASGEWLLEDALTGSSQQDIKNGGHSIRLRKKGKLAMQFDIQPLQRISISHAAYGSDGKSAWQLWASTDEGKTYKQVGETITSLDHQLIETVFKVNFNQPVRLEIRKISGSKNRINIDDIHLNSSGAELSVSGSPSPVQQNTADDQSETQDVAVPASASQQVNPDGDNSHILLGNPSNANSSTANPENYLIDQKYYVISYSRSKTAPNWVSWHIGASDLGNTQRANDFRADSGLPSGWYQADNTSYKNSGFDKGHNCPSGDRTSSTAANSSTFLMDNMIPQAPNNNQHTWEQLESYCRAQVKRGNEVYVIMGSYGSGGTGKNGFVRSIDNGRINVPSNIWKVVVIMPEGNHDLDRITAETRIIAINTPNDDSISPNWMNYVCTVRDIEKATGYNLFSALPKSLQDVIEVEKFKGGN